MAYLGDLRKLVRIQECLRLRFRSRFGMGELLATRLESTSSKSTISLKGTELRTTFTYKDWERDYVYSVTGIT